MLITFISKYNKQTNKIFVPHIRNISMSLAINLTINAQLFRYLTEGAILKKLVCYVQLDKPEMY